MAKHGRLTKTQSERIHSKKRAVERYGFEPNRHDIRQWVQDIQHQKATFVESQSNRVSVYIVQHDGQDVKVVYDKSRHNIVT